MGQPLYQLSSVPDREMDSDPDHTTRLVNLLNLLKIKNTYW